MGKGTRGSPWQKGILVHVPTTQLWSRKGSMWYLPQPEGTPFSLLRSYIHSFLTAWRNKLQTEYRWRLPSNRNNCSISCSSCSIWPRNMRSRAKRWEMSSQTTYWSTMTERSALSADGRILASRMDIRLHSMTKSLHSWVIGRGNEAPEEMKHLETGDEEAKVDQNKA